jgi:hypothetical protein
MAIFGLLEESDRLGASSDSVTLITVSYASSGFVGKVNVSLPLLH